MRGFIFGLIAIPSGLAVGGLMLGLPVRQLFFNMIPVLVLCMVLIAAFVLVPALTMKIMIFLGNAIRIFSFLLFHLFEQLPERPAAGIRPSFPDCLLPSHR